MVYNNTNIILSRWFPIFGQGLTISKNLCFVKFIYHKIYGVSIGQTARIIQHELVHAEQIKRVGWLKFMVGTIYNYITKGMQSGYELEANQAEEKLNPELADLLIDYCAKNGLRNYW